MDQSAVALPPYHDLLVVVLGHELPGQLGPGWSEAVHDPTLGSHRWAGARAQLRLAALKAPMRLTVRAGLAAGNAARPAALFVERRRVWRGVIGEGLRDIAVDLPRRFERRGSLDCLLVSAPGPGLMVQRVWVEAVPEAEHRPVALRPRWRDWWEMPG